MPNTLEKTVREFAAETPASIRVFESLGIDYCCGGEKPLSEACARADVDLDRVLALIEEASRDSEVREEEWTNKPLSGLITHIIEKHHSYVRQEIPRIQSLLRKVVAKHGSTHPEIAEIDRLFSAVGHELATHLIKEEQVLFPYIAQLEEAIAKGDPAPVPFFGTVRHPVAMMVAEHDDAGSLTGRMRELANGYQIPAGACTSFAALYRQLDEFEHDLHRHIHLENNILFPRAVRLEQAQ